jgi:phage-related protein (TIGR01555 family)
VSKKNKKQNFLQSDNPNSTKGDTILDPVASQIVGEERRLQQKEIDVMHNDYAFCKRILREIAGASLKSGFIVKSGNEELDLKVMKRFTELECSDYIVELLINGLKDGICFMFPIIEGPNLETGKELDLRKINRIRDINLFYARDINQIQRQMDKTIERYGECKNIDFKNSYGKVQNVKIDSSWIITYEPYPRVDKYTPLSSEYGDSFYKALWDLLIVKDNGIWSVGQLAYAMLLKKLKIGDQTKLDSILNRIGKDKYQVKKEMEINSSTLITLGANDDLQSVGFTQGLNIKDLKDYIYNELSAALGIPMSKLVGSSQGALASAKEDSNRWYEYIEAFQKDNLDEILRKVIKLLYAEQKKYDIEFELEFNSIRAVDEKEKAEIGKIEAETLKINVEALIQMQKMIEGFEIDKATLESLKDSLLNKIKDLSI